MRVIYDPDQRELAKRIEWAFPRWLVMWGAYSRQFWAYPRFRVPRGTIAHAARPDDLAGMMRAIQQSAAIGGARSSGASDDEGKKGHAIYHDKHPQRKAEVA